MGLSRQEINLRRLLAKCELMCKSNQKHDERFPKYIESLDNMLLEVKKLTDHSNESVFTYQRRIVSLKTELGIPINDTLDNESNAEVMRDDLLGLRHRNATEKNSLAGTKDLDQVIDYHENMQQKITADMLILTKNLREQSEMANKIIKKDTEIVGRSAQLADQNYSKLTVESNKLAEHSKRAWKCWMWIMLLIVMVVFINMVLFMKVVKKSK